MNIKIYPSKVSNTVSIPSSKSIAHRAIICASLSKGKSVISNITYSKDIEATISCMRSLGAKIKTHKTSCTIEGTDLFNLSKPIECDCNESGSTLRFLIPLGALTQSEVTYLGKGRLLSRPMEIYEKIFNEQKLFFHQDEKHIKIKGNLKPGDYRLNGNISSQFISGLMFVLPLLDGDSTIHILEPYESKSYVHLTIDMLKQFNIEIKETSNTSYFIRGNQTYKAKDICVEGDYSQAAFFNVLSCLNNEITCTNMNQNSYQGDKAILDILKNAGCKITQTEDKVTVSTIKPNSQTIDLSNCPDLGPILCVLAAYSKGTTHIINAQRLRMKESDRIDAMECELKKWNVDITSDASSITIEGKPFYSNDEIVILDSHNDHRIVMAMTVFGLCANTPCIIENAQAITKSYPNFFDDIQRINGKVEIV